MATKEEREERRKRLDENRLAAIKRMERTEGRILRKERRIYGFEV